MSSVVWNFFKVSEETVIMTIERQLSICLWLYDQSSSPLLLLHSLDLSCVQSYFRFLPISRAQYRIKKGAVVVPWCLWYKRVYYRPSGKSHRMKQTFKHILVSSASQTASLCVSLSRCSLLVNGRRSCARYGRECTYTFTDGHSRVWREV